MKFNQYDRFTTERIAFCVAIALLLSVSGVNAVAQTESGYIGSYAYVDLGLSVKWATCNVGANTAEDFGDYYGWAELSTREDYNYESYPYNGTWSEDISGNQSYDIARAKWGEGWRMPTKAEADELIKKCKFSHFRIDNKNYAKFTAPNGNYIVLPFCDQMIGDEKIMTFCGWYWTSTPHNEYEDMSYYFYFDQKYVGISEQLRYYGFNIRPVAN